MEGGILALAVDGSDPCVVGAKGRQLGILLFSGYARPIAAVCIATLLQRSIIQLARDVERERETFDLSGRWVEPHPFDSLHTAIVR